MEEWFGFVIVIDFDAHAEICIAYSEKKNTTRVPDLIWCRSVAFYHTSQKRFTNVSICN